MYRSGKLSPVRPALALLLGLSLSGCALFAPRYDATLAANVVAANEAVAMLAAKGELGSFEKPESFDGAADSYATALGKLKSAELQAGNLSVDSSLAERERGNLGAIIAGCSAQVLRFARTHHKSGIAPEAGLTEPMAIACDRAVRAVLAQKK